MERVLEPEVMDSEEEAREYDAMDFSQADRSFAEHAARLVGDGQVSIVDLGCGPCGIAILMAELLPNARFVCVDLAGSMLELAQVKLARLGLSERVTLLHADVKATGLPAGSFDLVMSNSTMHHLPEPIKLLREMKRLVAPKGAWICFGRCRPRRLGRSSIRFHPMIRPGNGGYSLLRCVPLSRWKKLSPSCERWRSQVPWLSPVRHVICGSRGSARSCHHESLALAPAWSAPSGAALATNAARPRRARGLPPSLQRSAGGCAGWATR